MYWAKISSSKGATEPALLDFRRAWRVSTAMARSESVVPRPLFSATAAVHPSMSLGLVNSST
jgi:hypothetical protein